jgi:fumarate reductase (CoM/CoB) subunit A
MAAYFESIMKDIPVVQTDVLVVGGGGAGMRAAIEAAARGRSVIVANKGPVGRSGTTPMAMEAFQAVCVPGDSEEIHFRDTVEGGRYLGDENLIWALVRDAAQRARDLETYGVQFKRKSDGAFDPMHHPGQTFPRALFIQGGGFGMLAGLIREARRHPAIQILDDVLVARLILDPEGIASGAVCLDLKAGQWKAVQSKAVILATGGYEELWLLNDAASTACGDGVCLAYDAGAELVDLEMLQYYPTVVIHPPSIQGTLFQYELITNSEVLGGRLLNGKMEPFFEGLLLRDAIVRAIWQEVRGGRGSPHGGVFIDLVHSTKSREALTRALEKWQPNQFHYLKDMGFDLRKVLVEVAPHAHYTLGGVAIDEECRTTVPGLFAAGEVAGNLHGANRVSGNALAETQVFGFLSGASAAAWAKKRRRREIRENCPEMSRKESPMNGPEGRERLGSRPCRFREQFQKIMWESCGVERDAQGLRQGMEHLDDLEEEAFPRTVADHVSLGASHGSYPQEILEAQELRMMISVGRRVLGSAYFRKETRGHHMRKDYPSSLKEPRHSLLSKGKEPWEGEVGRKT